MLRTSARAHNIDGGGRRRRMLVGGAMMLAALVALSVMLATGTGRGLRVALFVPFWLGALGLAQGATGT